MTPDLDSGAVWMVQKVSPDEDTGVTRLLSAGEAVPANAPIVVRHRATSQALFCDPAVVDRYALARGRLSRPLPFLGKFVSTLTHFACLL